LKKNISILFLLFVLLSGTLAAQQTAIPNSNQSSKTCGTIIFLENLFKYNPAAKLQFEKDQAALEKKYTEQLTSTTSANTVNRIQAITTIPVVVHIVLPNANDVTDAAVIDQLNILNADYAGLNTDSTNATAFYPVRGHPEIRFCLAQRTPADLSTTGIERKNSSVFSVTGGGDPIKFTSQGGLDAWDPAKYLNIWVGQTTSPGGGQVLLGYGTFPGLSVPLNEHGVVIQYRGFSSINPAGTTLFSFANKGRTLVHELGHFFNLQHIWGDQAGCTTDDGVADTPLQDVASSGCSSGIIFDACSLSGAGINYQNYMDYSDDACLTMFTNQQGVRMNTALSDPTRIGLTTSNGCSSPFSTPNDASISAMINPVANATTCDPTTPLTVTLRNTGNNILSSVIITVVVNGITTQALNFSGLNMASGATQNYTLNTVTILQGSNTIQVCTSLPNGVADTGPANDCKINTITKFTPAALPLVESFEGLIFPPTNWQLINPDAGLTWERNTNGLAHSGTADAYINHYNYTTINAIDDIITPPYSIGTTDSLWVSFWGAYKGFPNNTYEELQVAVSSNCGGSFTTLYNVRNDTAFGVSPINTLTNWTPSSADQWKKKSIDLSGFIPQGSIQVRFRATNKHGNNFYLDDINIDKKIFPNNDAGVIGVNNPTTRICVSSGVPVVVIKNYGKTNLTSVKINYQLDGAGAVTIFNWTGNLPRNQTATVSLAIANFGTTGNHAIRIYTTEPNGVTDEDISNDSQTKNFQVLQIISLPASITEEFTGSGFPPAGWNVYNPDADMTWARNTAVGKKNIGSAWFNDFNNNSFDRTDDLAMPNYSYAGIDSVFLTFNLATISKTVPTTTGSRFDTLSVLLSKDCGNSFTTIYKKYGAELETVINPTASDRTNPYIPLSNQWRMDSVNLGSWLTGTEPDFQVSFRFSGNFENNLFLDDINIRTEILPERLKKDGYLILPNPFRNSFSVWHYELPLTLRYINVYNAVGQLVWSRKYNFNEAGKLIDIDLGGRAAGIYNVRLGYTDKNKNVTVPVMKY